MPLKGQVLRRINFEGLLRKSLETNAERLICGYEYSALRLRNRAGSKNTLHMSIKNFARRIKASLGNMNIFEKIAMS